MLSAKDVYKRQVHTLTDTAGQDAADRFEQNCPLAAAIAAEVVLSICNKLAKM